MQMTEKWIWLPADLYPDRQTTHIHAFHLDETAHYTVAEFKKKYTLSGEVEKIILRFSGDTLYQLYLNDSLLATGPVTTGGDFYHNEVPRNIFYATTLEIRPTAQTLNFLARVQMMPEQGCDFSKGHGGFMLTAQITFRYGDWRA